MKMERGFRTKLDSCLNTAQPITVKLRTDGNAVYDTCCFCVDSSEKLSDDRYMVFYNQPVSPANEITYRADGNTAEYQVQLTALPASVAKLVFTVSIDGAGTMGQIRSHSIELWQDQQMKLELTLNGSDFQAEKAIIGLEIYKKDVWRIAVVARGFNGGLDALLKNYGGEVAEDSQPAPTPQPAPAVSSEQQVANRVMSRINLSKDKVNLEKHVVNLSKTVVDLSKKSGVHMENLRAKVVVVLDYSGSMTGLFRSGAIQQTINRLVPLGLTFDDNGSVDLFLFQDTFRQMEDLTLLNYESYVANVINRSGYHMGGTSYAPVLKAITEGYSLPSQKLFGKATPVPPIVGPGEPTFILFITDGANSDKGETNRVLRRISGDNVFIQFIGIGKAQFEYLEKLDTLSGRVRDNTGFSKMTDLAAADDCQLYEIVLSEFARWLKGLQ